MLSGNGRRVPAIPGVDRRARHEIGIERLHVVVGKLGEMIVGQTPGRAASRACDAFPHGARKGSLGPGADAGLGIRCDVARVNHAEGRCHGIAAGEFLSAFGGVTLRAIAAAGECCALRDQGRRETCRRRRCDRRNHWPPRQCAEAQDAQDSERDDGDEEALCHSERLTPIKRIIKYALKQLGKLRQHRLRSLGSKRP